MEFARRSLLDRAFCYDDPEAYRAGIIDAFHAVERARSEAANELSSAHPHASTAF
jgi:hypothetical protein